MQVHAGRYFDDLTQTPGDKLQSNLRPSVVEIPLFASIRVYSRLVNLLASPLPSPIPLPSYDSVRGASARMRSGHTAAEVKDWK